MDAAASVAGAVVLVTNGYYQTGGDVINRVAVMKPLQVRSVNGPGVTIIDGGNSTRCVYLGESAALAGFTLFNGVAYEGDGSGGGGGGVWCASVSTVVSNCVLTDNLAFRGGGAYFGTLTGCTLSGNYATLGGGAHSATLNNCALTGNSASDIGGGALLCTLNNCTLTGNSAGLAGGGASDSTLTQCMLIGNSAVAGGRASGGTLNNCTLTGNSASNVGGGARGSTFNNCTLTDNSASDQGGGAFHSTLNNCIAYFNSAANDANWWGGVLSFCCTTPLFVGGVGNFTNAPVFLDLPTGNLRLQVGSPCINAGKNLHASARLDLDGNPRIVGGTVDIGAYEFQNPASTISYAWLQQYGLSTDGSADNLDPDADRLTNYDEWRAGTDPLSPLSALRLLTPSFEGINWLVSWQSVPERAYTVERSINLSVANSFLPVATTVPGQSGTTTVIDTNSTAPGPAIYRVRVEE